MKKSLVSLLVITYTSQIMPAEAATNIEPESPATLQVAYPRQPTQIDPSNHQKNLLFDPVDYTIFAEDEEALKQFNIETQVSLLQEALALSLPHKTVHHRKTPFIQYLIAEPNAQETKPLLKENSYLEERPALLKLIIQAVRLFNEGVLKNTHYSNENYFSACSCIEAPERILMALITVIKTVQSIEKETPIVYVSLGSGYLLQDYVILSLLKLLAFHIEEIALIDHEHPHLVSYLQTKLDHKKEMRRYYDVKDFLSSFNLKNFSTYLLTLSDPDTTPEIFTIMMDDFKELISTIPSPARLITSIMYNSKQKDLVTFDVKKLDKEGPQYIPPQEYSYSIAPAPQPQSAPAAISLDLKPIEEIEALFIQYKKGGITLEEILAQEENPPNKVRIQTIFKRLEKDPRFK